MPDTPLHHCTHYFQLNSTISPIKDYNSYPSCITPQQSTIYKRFSICSCSCSQNSWKKSSVPQVSEFFESNNLLTKNQNGFRAKRSTMTAWSEMQENWAKNSEDKNMTGILLWDLSAAFDTLDPELLCKKMKIYGFDEIAISWFFTFLTEKNSESQDRTSIALKLRSGVPQGRITCTNRYKSVMWQLLRSSK